jgi:hypothetical protein
VVIFNTGNASTTPTGKSAGMLDATLELELKDEKFAVDETVAAAELAGDELIATGSFEPELLPPQACSNTAKKINVNRIIAVIKNHPH